MNLKLCTSLKNWFSFRKVTGMMPANKPPMVKSHTKSKEQYEAGRVMIFFSTFVWCFDVGYIVVGFSSRWKSSMGALKSLVTPLIVYCGVFNVHPIVMLALFFHLVIEEALKAYLWFVHRPKVFFGRWYFLREGFVSSESFQWTRQDSDTCSQSNMFNENFHWTQAAPIFLVHQFLF